MSGELNPYPHSQFEFNSSLGLVAFSDKINRLTKQEANLLGLLMSNINKLTSYDKLWEYYQPVNEKYEDQRMMIDSMKAIISRLRKKLPESGNKLSQYQTFDDHFIRTVRTHGFFIYDPRRSDFDNYMVKT